MAIQIEHAKSARDDARLYVRAVDDETGDAVGHAELWNPDDPRGSSIWAVGVSPEYRRQGIATAMVSKLMQLVAPGATCHLYATEMGRPVYERLGFVANGDRRYNSDAYMEWTKPVD